MQSSDRPNPIAAVILTALRDEANAVLEELTDIRPVESRHRLYFEGSFGDRRLVVWPVEAMGNVAAGVAARNAVALLNPPLLVLTGITGGIEDKGRSLGDVVVPDQIVYSELGKIRAGATARRWEVYRPSLEFRTAARRVASQPWWSPLAEPRPDGTTAHPAVHFGVVLSGEKVIADDAHRDELVSAWPKSIGIEMESFGAALAMYESEDQPLFGVVKAISDWANPKKDDRWRAYACRAAARFSLEVVMAIDVPNERPQPQVAGSALSTHASSEVKAGWGRKRIELCRRLTDEEVLELADWFDIPDHERKSWHDRCRDLWDWLFRRGKLSELPQALIDVLERHDLVALVESAVGP